MPAVHAAMARTGGLRGCIVPRLGGCWVATAANMLCGTARGCARAPSAARLLALLRQHGKHLRGKVNVAATQSGSRPGHPQLRKKTCCAVLPGALPAAMQNRHSKLHCSVPRASAALQRRSTAPPPPSHALEQQHEPERQQEGHEEARRIVEPARHARQRILHPLRRTAHTMPHA